jgi:hypothetical protein
MKCLLYLSILIVHSIWAMESYHHTLKITSDRDKFLESSAKEFAYFLFNQRFGKSIIQIFAEVQGEFERDRLAFLESLNGLGFVNFLPAVILFHEMYKTPMGSYDSMSQEVLGIQKYRVLFEKESHLEDRARAYLRVNLLINISLNLLKISAQLYESFPNTKEVLLSIIKKVYNRIDPRFINGESEKNKNLRFYIENFNKVIEGKLLL